MILCQRDYSNNITMHYEEEFQFLVKKKTNCTGHDACMYIYFANCMTLCLIEFEIGWQCPTKGDSEDNWQWIFLSIASWWI